VPRNQPFGFGEFADTPADIVLEATAQDGGSGAQTVEDVTQAAVPAYKSISLLCTRCMFELSSILFSSSTVMHSLSGEYLLSSTSPEVKLSASASQVPKQKHKPRFSFFKPGFRYGEDAKKMGLDRFTCLRDVWVEAVQVQKKTPLTRVIDVAVEEITYAAEMLEGLSLMTLILICFEKVILLFYLVIIEQNDHADNFSHELCAAFGADVEALCTAFDQILALLSPMPSVQTRCKERIERSFLPLKGAANLLISTLQGDQLVLSIQGLFEQSTDQGMADVVALSRLLETIVTIRLSREIDEEEQMGEGPEREEKALWRSAANLICMSSSRAMICDAQFRPVSAAVSIDDTCAIPCCDAPLLRVAFGPLPKDYTCSDVDNMPVPSRQSSPIYFFTSMELLHGSNRVLKNLLKEFIRAEEKRENELHPKQKQAILHAVSLSNVSGGKTAASGKSREATQSTKSPVQEDMSDGDDVAATMIVVHNMSVTNLPSLGMVKPKVILKLALISSMTRFIDFSTVEWVARSSSVKAASLTNVSFDEDQDEFVIRAVQNLQSMDLVVGVFYKARVYGEDTLVYHSRANMGFLSISSIDNRRLKTLPNMDDPTIAAAVDKEDSFYIDKSVLLLSVRLAD
jgi:hypothetical protein